METDPHVDSGFVREVVLDASFGIVAVDESGAIVYTNDRVRDLLGYESGGLVNQPIEICFADRETVTADALRELATNGDGGVDAQATFRRTDGDRVPVSMEAQRVDADHRTYYVLLVRESPETDRDSGQSRRQDATVLDADSAPGNEAGAHGGAHPQRGDVDETEALVELGRELTSRDTIDDVAETGLTAVTRLFDTDVACLRRYVPKQNTLERIATTDTAADLLESRPAFDLDATLAGRAFRRGEPVVETRPEPDSASNDGRTSLHVPVGDRVVLTLFTPADATASEAAVDLAERIATLLAANLDRVDRERDRRETTERLQVERDGYAATVEFAEGIYDTIDQLLRSQSRSTVERRLSKQVIDGERFTAAWVVEATVDGSWEEEPVASSTAADQGSIPVPQHLDKVVEEAIEDDGVTDQYRCETSAVGAAESAVPEDSDAMVAGVPLKHDDCIYAVLLIRSPQGEVFDEHTRSALETVGELAGFVLHAVDRRKLLLSDEVIELEFFVTDDGCFSVALSDALDAAVEMQRSLLTKDHDHLFYVTVEGASGGAASAAAERIDGVTDSRVITDHDDGCVIEVVKTHSGADAMLDVGATMRQATAESGAGTLVVEVPVGTDTREVVERYQEINPDSELVAKREVERPVRTAKESRELVDDVLTDRQRSVVEAAYYAGYYDWPRKSTAEEVAESFGVAPATFHQHVRKAERGVLSAFLDADS